MRKFSGRLHFGLYFLFGLWFGGCLVVVVVVGQHGCGRHLLVKACSSIVC